MALPLKSLNYTLLSQTEAENNGTTTIRRRRWSDWTIRDIFKWGLLGLLILGLSVGFIVYRVKKSRDRWPEAGSDLACPQWPALHTLSDDRGKLETELLELYASTSFNKGSIAKLQGAVRIPTESYDDMGKVGEDPRWEIFKDFHAYLEKTFPLV